MICAAVFQIRTAWGMLLTTSADHDLIIGAVEGCVKPATLDDSRRIRRYPSSRSRSAGDLQSGESSAWRTFSYARAASA